MHGDFNMENLASRGVLQRGSFGKPEKRKNLSMYDNIETSTSLYFILLSSLKSFDFYSGRF